MFAAALLPSAGVLAFLYVSAAATGGWAAPSTAPSTKAVSATAPAARPAGDWPRMRGIAPRGYVCGRARHPVVIDGRADDAAWADAPWTDDFARIEGTEPPGPRYRTRAKALWDDEALYVYAELQQPHVWAAVTEWNAPVFRDNAFELFLDPDGDHHNYYEFQVNALNTVWELTLAKPYRDGGPARSPTNLAGLRSAVHVDGTLNDPSDADRGWSAEVAIPWAALVPFAGAKACPPTDGDQWRAELARTDWAAEVVGGAYRKVVDPKRPGAFSAWSPVGVADLHRPERWGYVQFSSSPATATFRPDPTLAARDALMEVYYRQREHRRRVGRYAASAAELGLETGGSGPVVQVSAVAGGYAATTTVTGTGQPPRVLRVREDSRMWEE